MDAFLGASFYLCHNAKPFLLAKLSKGVIGCTFIHFYSLPSRVIMVTVAIAKYLLPSSFTHNQASSFSTDAICGLGPD